MAGTENSGRRPDWFRERCADILGEYELVEFVGRVAAGKEKEQRYIAGELVNIACETRDRLTAFKMLAEWGVGKPVQYVQQSGMTPSDSVRNAQQIFEMIQQLEAGKLALAGATNGNGSH